LYGVKNSKNRRKEIEFVFEIFPVFR